MDGNLYRAIDCCWDAVAIVWLIGLASTKRTVRGQRTAGRLFYLALLVLGFFLVGNRIVDLGWLDTHLLAPSHSIVLAGLVMTASGCLFAIWARIKLGSNWSGRPAVKERHELVVQGPYALARHPIYTGVLVAAIGTAATVARVRCLLGLTLLVIAFLIKMGQEEKLMMETFPVAYPAYRRRVKALIPGVF